MTTKVLRFLRNAFFVYRETGIYKQDALPEGPVGKREKEEAT